MERSGRIYSQLTVAGYRGRGELGGGGEGGDQGSPA